MTRITRLGLAGVLGAIAVGATVPAGITAAASGPTAEEVVQRVMHTIAGAPEVIAADAEFRLRIKKPLSEPPDCVFRGTVTVVSHHPTINIDGQTVGLLCWVVNLVLIYSNPTSWAHPTF